MRLVIDTDRFWLLVVRFSYRRLRNKFLYQHGGIPDGVPTIRDVDARCTGYEPRKNHPGDWDCEGDGHYLCSECCHLVRCDGDCDNCRVDLEDDPPCNVATFPINEDV